MTDALSAQTHSSIRAETKSTRHERMLAASTWLARQDFATIGWALTADGKAPNRRWKDDATDDPALVAGLLHGARNALVIPKGSGLVIDFDDPAILPDLQAAGLPETLIVDSPTPGHGHVYGWAPGDVDMSAIPANIRGGEVRRHSPATGTASMVLGPWALRGDGIYTPRPGVRVIAELPHRVIDYLIASERKQTSERNSARGPTDDGWYIDHGRHDFLVSRGRNLRGIGLSGERLYDELVRVDRDRCRPPLADTPGRGLDELSGIAAWIEKNIADDPPEVSAQTSAVRAETPMAFQSARTFAAAVPDRITWRWRDYWADGTVVEMVGKIKAAGKTTLLMHACRAILDGLPFLDRPTLATPVVYLTEQPSASLREALRRADLLGRDDFTLLLWRDTAGRRWPDVVRAAVEECHRQGAKVLVIDTLSRFAGLRGDAENSAGDADEAMAPLQVAAADGLAVIVARHERKSGGEVGDSGRGSSAFAGAVDVVLAVRRGEGNVRPTVRVIHALSRFDETPETLVVELTEDGYVALGDEQAVALTEAKKAVRDLLPDRPSPEAPTFADLKDRLGAVPRSTLQRAVDDLLAAHEIAREGAGKRGDPFRYYLPPNPDPDSNVSAQPIGNEFGPKQNGVDLIAAARRIFREDLLEPEVLA